MIDVRNLTKKYGSFEALSDVSFTVKKGLVEGFLGPNGAGKSTTMNILAGLTGYDTGEIRIGGEDLKSNRKELSKKVGYLPESPEYYGYMNSYEYLAFIGRIAGYPSGKLEGRIDELLELSKLTADAHRKVSGYSRGMKQRLALAVAMLNDPEILILDEPTSALDPEGRREMMELIEKLKSEGKTVFLSTHILSDVERVCDEVNIINHGRIILSESLEQLKNSYIQPVYDIEFNGGCGDLKDILAGVDWVSKVIVNGNVASVFVKDVAAVKNRLLHEVSRCSETVVSYNLRKSNLEDIFIRLVK